MKKTSKNFIASLMLAAFMSTNLAMTVSAYDTFTVLPPDLRDGNSAPMSIKSDNSLSNGDSVVNLSLRDADVTQVLRMFADQAGMNIIFSTGVSGKVTMDLVDVTLEDAFNLVISVSELGYDIRSNTIIVADGKKEIAGSSRDINIIPVKYVGASSIASFLNDNIFVQGGQPGLSKKGVVTVNPATNELIVMGTAADVAAARKIVEQFDKKPTITTFTVNHTTPAEMADMICNTLIPSTVSSSGSGGGGGKSSKSSRSTGGAAGVPTGFASSSSSSSSSSSGGSDSGITVGGSTLACSVETSASSGDIKGLDFVNMSVSYFPTQGKIQVIGGSEHELDLIREYIALTDKKSPQAYLEVQIISLTESGSKTFDNTWQFLSNTISFNAGGGSGISTFPTLPIFFAGHGYTPPQIGDTAPNPLQKWSSSPQLTYALNYLIENRKGRVLANPRILITSGQSSTIDLTSDYVQKVTTQYLDNGSSSGSAQVQRDYEIGDDNGIQVTITPFISPDGYVTLDIEPQYNTIGEQIYTKGDAGDDLQATLLQRRNLSLKGVRIKDGETLVIGGMISENESKTVSKIPFLGDIPVLGMFFRSTSTNKSKEEMVIMLTPQIIVDTEDAVGVDETTL